MKRTSLLIFLILNLADPLLVNAHFGVVDDQSMVGGVMVDKTLLLGVLILGFIILTIIFQILRKKRV